MSNAEAAIRFVRKLGSGLTPIRTFYAFAANGATSARGGVQRFQIRGGDRDPSPPFRDLHQHGVDQRQPGPLVRQRADYLRSPLYICSSGQSVPPVLPEVTPDRKRRTGVQPCTACHLLARRACGDQPPTARLRESPVGLSTRYIRLLRSRCNTRAGNVCVHPVLALPRSRSR